MDGHTDTSYEWAETVRMAIQALKQMKVKQIIGYMVMGRLSNEHNIEHNIIANYYIYPTREAAQREIEYLWEKRRGIDYYIATIIEEE